MFSRRGFTLIELLLVIGIIGLLSSIVIVAINPTKQLEDAENAKRRLDVKAIADAVYEFLIDNEQGQMPQGLLGDSITSVVREICVYPDNETLCFINGDKVSLEDLIPTYLPALPTDPQRDPVLNPHGIGYYISITDGRITVEGPNGITFTR